MEFFYQKSLECLRHVENVEYTSTWKTEAFGVIRRACRELSAELNAAKEQETSLLAWRERLAEAKTTFGGDIDKYNGTVGSSVEYAKVVDIIGEIMTCRKMITEMLRILNPGEKKYQIWFAPGERERFLKNIGFQEGRMPEIVHMQTLLSRMKELTA